uniref:Uncharacterized protein n=1 Tax=Mus spicilegus TaxID=10103 RepID=A0A8C6GPT5_MUSSI
MTLYLEGFFVCFVCLFVFGLRLTAPYLVPFYYCDSLFPSTWSSLAVNVGHVRKYDDGSPQTFQGVTDYFVFNLHQVIYLWFFSPKYSVVSILMIGM